MKSVADQLNISVRTAQKHRERACARLGLKGSVMLTHWALAHGLVRNRFALFILLPTLLLLASAGGGLGAEEGRAVAAASPQPKAEQQLRPTPNSQPPAPLGPEVDEMQMAIMRRREVVATNVFRVTPVVKFHQRTKPQ